MHGPMSRLRGRGRALALAAGLLASTAGWANPQGAHVVHGTAGFATPAPGTLEITNSPGAVLNWQSFDISLGETTRFVQQGAQSAVLNRVVTPNSSEIYGNLLSNGRVFLINPSGILIGRDAVVDTAGLVMSTLDIADDDFLAGRLRFEGDAASAGITNHGYVKTAPGGEIVLIAPRIVNEPLPGNPDSGLIESPGGELVLAAGHAITLASLDHPDITFEVRAPDDEVVNLGRLLANGGSVNVIAGTLRHSGEINADSMTVDAAGRIVLAASDTIILDEGSRVSASGPGDAGSIDISAGDGGGDGRVYALGDVVANGNTGGEVAIEADRVLAAGSLRARGEIDGGTVEVTAHEQLVATAGAHFDAGGGAGAGGRVAIDGGQSAFSSGLATAAGTTGGEVEILAEEITLAAATVDASGVTGGGRVRIGGGFQGGEGLPAAQTVVANGSTVIKANAGAIGDGGSVVVWSDGETRFGGLVDASAGEAGGDGGLVEISGREALGYGGQVDVTAPAGSPGTLLLDPKNIIFSGGTQGAGTFQLLDPQPGANNNFGQTTQSFFEPGITGPAKLLVFDQFDDFGGADAGAAYLYRMSDGALLSTLTGSQAGDRIGSSTVQFVGNGYVLRSPMFNGSAGALTPYDVVNGTSGMVSAANSLVGAAPGDAVGSAGLQTLTGNVVAVRSPAFSGNAGAVTVAQRSALAGVVAPANSLVGANPGDQLGLNFLQSVGNGNFVLRSTHGGAGAVSFINSANPAKGLVGPGNSLVGSAPADNIGSGGVQTLGSNRYAVLSPAWNANRGALTVGSTLTGVAGVLGAGNSLVGSAAGDAVGGNGLQSLFFGYFGMISDLNGFGAATVFAPTAAPVGVVSNANSLVGTLATDQVGSGGFDFIGGTTWALLSPLWDVSVPVADAGAVTVVDGTTGTFAGTATPFNGDLGAANSLVGASANDQVGSGGIDFFVGSTYGIKSPLFDNVPQATADGGAITWYVPGNALSGAVSNANSLVGKFDNDDLGGGSNSMFFLSSGDALLYAPDHNGSAGAVVWLDAAGPVIGDLGDSTALVGGTPGDMVGDAGIELFDNHYIVLSPDWDDGGPADRGAVTVVDNGTGLTGFVGAANSLIGPNAGDRLGDGGVIDPGTGNAIVYSPDFDTDAGAVTFLDLLGGALIGDTDFIATLDDTNSLVGDNPGDMIGSGGIEILDDGSYLVLSPAYDPGSAAGAGAVTYGDDFLGVAGRVDNTTSLAGVNGGDGVGGGGITTLSNGNVLIESPAWNGGMGAVTFFDLGTALFGGVANGDLSAANSLVGASPGDAIGAGVGGGIDEFFTGAGYYGVFSPNFDNGPADAGAVTFGDVNTGITGVVSNLNSITGTNAGDRIGDNLDYHELNNGNLVLLNDQWNGNRGAARFVDLVNGAGLSGDIAAGNSVVGSTAGDMVGSQGVTDFFFGSTLFALESPEWTNGGNAQAGAVTWGNIDTGFSGAVGPGNSLVGVNAGDRVGDCCSIDFVTGNLWVVDIPAFDGNRSALTFFDSTVAPPVGAVDATNSLLGSTPGDALGNFTIFSVFNPAGNRVVVMSPDWDNGAMADAGAITTFLASAPAVGTLSAANSFIGANAGDEVGDSFPTFLSNGNRVFRSLDFNGGAGAVTFWDTSTNLVGTIGAGTSLVGSNPGDSVGSSGVQEASGSGRYYVRSPNWNMQRGAVTFGSITGGVSGVLGAGNSLVGGFAMDRVGDFVLNPSFADELVVVSEQWNAVRGAVTVVDPSAPLLGTVSATNSLVGSAAGDRVGDFVQQLFSTDNRGLIALRTNTWNSNAGAVTILDPTAPVVGAVSATNSLVGRPGDMVGSSGITELSNGSVLVRSPNWSDGTGQAFGAATFMVAASPVTPVTGFVSAANSFVGSHMNDQVGSGGFTTLSSGNILLRSPAWFDNRGAVTFVDVTQGRVGELSGANSLVGELANDFLGSGGITTLGDDRALVRSPLASQNGIAMAGRLDIIDGATVQAINGDVGFDVNPGGDYLVSTASIVDFLNGGGTLLLQATNDIMVPLGSGLSALGGGLFLEAGRSITIEDDLIVLNGDLSLFANSPNGDPAQRDAGEGDVTLVAGEGPLRVMAANLTVDAQNVRVHGGTGASAYAALIGLVSTKIHAHGSGLVEVIAGTGSGSTFETGSSFDVIPALAGIEGAYTGGPAAAIVGTELLSIIADDVVVRGGENTGAFAAIASFGEFIIEAVNIDLEAGAGTNADAVLLGLGGLADFTFVNCEGCEELFFDPLFDATPQTGIHIAGLIQNPSTDAILAMLDDEEDAEEEDEEEDEVGECN